MGWQGQEQQKEAYATRPSPSCLQWAMDFNRGFINRWSLDKPVHIAAN